MEKESFKITSYTCQELALLYNPQVTPLSAVKLLSKWIHRNPKLVSELTAAGWVKGTRVLTPLQVEVIVRYLGAP